MGSIADYDYHLPTELIAQRPAARRDSARLMVLGRRDGTIAHRRFLELPQLLNPRDCLVLNDSRVIPARLEGRRVATGGLWSGLFLRTTDANRWEILSKTRGKLQPGERLALRPPNEDRSRLANQSVELRLVSRTGDGTWIAQPLTDAGWQEVLVRFGRVPLPPYIRQGRQAPGDRERYQTIYARRPGSVAAPTAGLHFTDAVLAEIRRRGIAVASVTLHVGWGTFRPIAGERVEQHTMHAEYGELSQESAEVINKRRRTGGRVVAVGSTSLRLLETAARESAEKNVGCGASHTGDLPSLGGAGAPAYDLTAWSGETNLYIYPPYQFRAVDALVTNFHLPRTTLLVMVSAFAGKEFMCRAYEEAIRRRYRFYSYGDAMLIV